MAEYGKNPWRVDVKVGDVIDMRGCDLIGLEGKEQTRLVVRAEHNKHTVELLAPKECIDLHYGRVTKILKVSHRTRRTVKGFFHYTDAVVELEDAWGETPTLICENSTMRAIAKDDRGAKQTEWKRPGFTTGDVKNAEKET